MPSNGRSLLISAAVFVVGAGVWLGAGVLRGIAHVAGLAILSLLEAVLYASVAIMVAGLVLLGVFIPQWIAARRG